MKKQLLAYAIFIGLLGNGYAYAAQAEKDIANRLRAATNVFGGVSPEFINHIASTLAKLKKGDRNGILDGIDTINTGLGNDMSADQLADQVEIALNNKALRESLLSLNAHLRKLINTKDTRTQNEREKQYKVKKGDKNQLKEQSAVLQKRLREGQSVSQLMAIVETAINNKNLRKALSVDYVALLEQVQGAAAAKPAGDKKKSEAELKAEQRARDEEARKKREQEKRDKQNKDKKGGAGAGKTAEASWKEIEDFINNFVSDNGDQKFRDLHKQLVELHPKYLGEIKDMYMASTTTDEQRGKIKEALIEFMNIFLKETGYDRAVENIKTKLPPTEASLYKTLEERMGVLPYAGG